MPAPTIETLQKREASLKGKLAAGGLAPERSKSLHKRLRRTQRRRRKDAARLAKYAKKAEPAGA